MRIHKKILCPITIGPIETEVKTRSFLNLERFRAFDVMTPAIHTIAADPCNGATWGETRKASCCSAPLSLHSVASMTRSAGVRRDEVLRAKPWMLFLDELRPTAR